MPPRMNLVPINLRRQFPSPWRTRRVNSSLLISKGHWIFQKEQTTERYKDLLCSWEPPLRQVCDRYVQRRLRLGLLLHSKDEGVRTERNDTYSTPVTLLQSFQ